VDTISRILHRSSVLKAGRLMGFSSLTVAQSCDDAVSAIRFSACWMDSLSGGGPSGLTDAAVLVVVGDESESLEPHPTRTAAHSAAAMMMSLGLSVVPYDAGF
jgi:hypothetical protein